MQFAQRITPFLSYCDQMAGMNFEALWQMTKLDIAELQKAFDGE